MFVGVIVALLSGVALFLASLITNDVLSTGLQNVAAVVLSLGLVSIIYEVFLRDTVRSETMELVGLSEDVEKSGLTGIADSSGPDWRKFCQSGEHLQVLLLNPLNWVQRDWRHFLDAARDRKVQIDLYIPHPESDRIEQVARRMGFDSHEFKQQIESSRNIIETGWRTQRDQENGGTRKGSSLGVRYYSEVAGYEVATNGIHTVVTIPSAMGGTPGDRSLLLEFDHDASRFPAKWLYGQIERLHKLPHEFSSEVK